MIVLIAMLCVSSSLAFAFMGGSGSVGPGSLGPGSLGPGSSNTPAGPAAATKPSGQYIQIYQTVAKDDASGDECTKNKRR